MKLINLTPHDVNFADENGDVIRTIPATKPSARVSSETIQKGLIDGIPFVETVFGNVIDLPEPENDTIYIVSQFVIAAMPHRLDLVRPDSGPSAIRQNGQIVAVKALTR